MRKFSLTIITLVAIFGIGAGSLKSGALLDTGKGDEVTKYIEETKNEEAGSDIENAAGYLGELFGIIVNAAKDGTLGKPVEDLESQVTYIKASQETIDKMSGKVEKAGIEEVSLLYVVDGDTIIVVGDDGLQYKVRLIGVDTPESVNRDESKNNQYGEMASDHTKEILDGVTTVYLEYDESVTDAYNRVLAYVWLDKNTNNLANMLNARILYEGYGVDKVYEPNVRYKKNFNKLRKEAEEEKRGLWEQPGYEMLVYND